MPDGNGGAQIIKALADYVGYLWMLALALWGGTVSYVTRIKAEGRNFKVLELLAQWLTSGFVGLLAGYISLTAADSLLLAFVFSGVAGHMGAAALVLLERWVKDRLGVKR
ncbi:MAG: phage holin family protein [Pseudomonadota bacterium]